LGAYLETSDGDSALAVQRALFILLTSIADRAAYEVYSYKGRIVVCKILAEARAAHGTSPLAVNWIPNIAARIANVLASLDVPEQAVPLVLDSATAMVADISQREQGDQITTADMGIFARPKDCLQLITVHRAKGHEFDAVAVIDVHDGRFPHFTVAQIADEQKRMAQYNESRRVMYVAATRAKRLLMFFTDTSNRRNRPSPFLGEMGF
jgi:DNA helicase-2/ATP-dependent DNA helicase PcrA